MGSAYSTNGEKRKAYRILVGKPEGKRPLGRPRRRWVDNIKTDIGDRVEWYGLDRSGSGQGPVEGSCKHGNELSGSTEYWKVLEWQHNRQCLNKAQLRK
jgi:hypothetical protein